MLLTMDLLSCFKEELEAMASRSEANDRQVHCSPFELWEIRLELVYVASYSGNADSSIDKETWGLDSSIKLSRGRRWYCMMPKCLRGLVLTFSRAMTHPLSSSREGCCMHRYLFIL
ncbi:hypothetical protein MIMGU_mgv1a016598mg [Erythranthe guttata]|uniref:Uncharacterized protein n=1 Tax=Erythranthe guttata TaxID=4155 RepID=A0A022QKY4_ERYGU|nr:hypothetical protein MIMGU_mgv1a016598mg [Erythranthe guttata]